MRVASRHAASSVVDRAAPTLVRLWAIAELHATTDGTRVRLGDRKTELAVACDRVRVLKERLG